MNNFDTDLNLITEKLVFITGLTRSGKSLLCPIISSLKNSEMFFTDANAENVSYLHALKKISYPVAKFLFKLSLNERIYNLSIGRNLNT